MSADFPLVTVFGGSGFLGRYVVRGLAARGYRVRVACRRPDLAGHLQPLGNVGQIHCVQANLRYRWSVERAVEGADCVVNLVGILAETGKQTFDSVQARGAGWVAEAAAAENARLVQISAIGADDDSAADYARTKATGEQAVRRAVPDAIILRPSVLFGPEDDFFNRFAAMACVSPALPLIGGGEEPFPAGLCGGCCPGRGQSGGRRSGSGVNLGAGRTGSAQFQTMYGTHAGGHQPPPDFDESAICRCQFAGRVCPISARRTADTGSGRDAEIRQYCIRGSQCRRAQSRGDGHYGDLVAIDLAGLSGAVSQARAIRGQSRSFDQNRCIYATEAANHATR